MLSLFTH